MKKLFLLLCVLIGFTANSYAAKKTIYIETLRNMSPQSIMLKTSQVTMLCHNAPLFIDSQEVKLAAKSSIVYTISLDYENGDYTDCKPVTEFTDYKPTTEIDEEDN